MTLEQKINFMLTNFPKKIKLKSRMKKLVQGYKEQRYFNERKLFEWWLKFLIPNGLIMKKWYDGKINKLNLW